MRAKIYAYIAAILFVVGSNWQKGANGQDLGVEILTRGPVHEAFAELPSSLGKPAALVTIAPPAEPTEQPTAERPGDLRLEWIPGYWAWEPDGDRHVWVSGIWRRPPPGRVWTPGYWTESLEGFRRVAGYWADANDPRPVYLPAPPVTNEEVPQDASPGAEFVWLPGGWVWRQEEYVWRRGQWTKADPGFVIVPAHYVWTERGYVFVSAYRDFLLTRRGVLFAPAAFDMAQLNNNFVWTPSIVINARTLPKFLFCHPDQHQYCFGDYFDPRYADVGVRPWFEHHEQTRGIEPLYAHYHWWAGHRGQRDWTDRVTGSFRRYRDNADIRPPRIYSASRAARAAAGRGVAWASPYREWVESSQNRLRRRTAEAEPQRATAGRLSTEERAARRRAAAIRLEQAAEERENNQLSPPYDEKTRAMRRGRGTSALNPPFDQPEQRRAMPRRSTRKPVTDVTPQGKGETPRGAVDDVNPGREAPKSKVQPNVPDSSGVPSKSPYMERRERKLIPQGQATKTRNDRPRGATPGVKDADSSPYRERKERKLIPQGQSTVAPAKPGQRGPRQTELTDPPKGGLNLQPAPMPKSGQPRPK